MSNYYFAAPSLPDLSFGKDPELTFGEVISRLEMNLSQKDLQQIGVLRLRFDLENIASHYLEKPLDHLGNLNEKELDEALLVEADLPPYVFEFLNQFEESKDKARHFFGLLSRYFSEETSKASGFLQELLTFQRELALVLTAMRAKRLGRDITRELQFEEPTDPFYSWNLSPKGYG